MIKSTNFYQAKINASALYRFKELLRYDPKVMLAYGFELARKELIDAKFGAVLSMESFFNPDGNAEITRQYARLKVMIKSAFSLEASNLKKRKNPFERLNPIEKKRDTLAKITNEQLNGFFDRYVSGISDRHYSIIFPVVQHEVEAIMRNYAKIELKKTDMPKKEWLVILPAAFSIAIDELKYEIPLFESVPESTFDNTKELYYGSTIFPDQNIKHFYKTLADIIKSFSSWKRIFIMNKVERKEEKIVLKPIKTYETPELIGQGSYGCVYRKPIRCKNGTEINEKYGSPAYLMKLATEEGVEKELVVSKLLQKIDPTQKYSLYFLTDGCEIDAPSIPTKGCKIYSKHMRGYIMKYGGVNLKEYILTHPHDITIDLVWRWLNKLIKGLVLFKKLSLIHQDIKPQNIVVNEEKDIFFIDFGLSYVFKPKELPDKRTKMTKKAQ